MRVYRRNRLLAAVWLALLISIWVLGRPGAAVARREIGRLFPQFQAALAARVLIERPARAGEATASSCELVRREDPGVEPAGGVAPVGGVDRTLWVLPAHFDHPANGVALRQLFDAVTSLTTLDLLAEDAQSHARYGVGAGGLSVRVFDAAGELIAGFVQGADASTGSGLASYVRPLGADEVFRAPRVGVIPVDPRYWLDRQWLAFQPALVREVRVEERGRQDTWRRADMERWMRAGLPVSARSMRALLDRLGALFFDDVVAPRPDGHESVLEIVLVMHDGSERSARFAQVRPDGTRDAWRGADEPVVRFSAASAALLSKALGALRGDG